MRRTEVSLELRLNRSEFSECRRDFAEDPGGREVGEEESD